MRWFSTTDGEYLNSAYIIRLGVEELDEERSFVYGATRVLHEENIYELFVGSHNSCEEFLEGLIL